MRQKKKRTTKCAQLNNNKRTIGQLRLVDVADHATAKHAGVQHTADQILRVVVPVVAEHARHVVGGVEVAALADG